MAVRKIQTNEPFLDRESAVAALGSFMDGTRITRGGMYLLNIINQLVQNEKEILERLPHEVFGGLPEGGRRNVAAAALCRAENSNVPPEQGLLLESGYTREQEIIGRWAERDGCWDDTPHASFEKSGYRHADDLDGSEAMVWFDDAREYVYKTIDQVRYPNIERFLDRVAIHNALFPECPMTVIGFGMRDYADDNSGFCALIRQPFVKGSCPTEEQIALSMHERGLVDPPAGAGFYYCNPSGSILLTDVHDSNCVLSDAGHVLVFDCEAMVNDIPAFGGRHVIPPLDYSEESVRAIRKEVEGMLPMEIPEKELLRLLGASDARILAEQLNAAGRSASAVKTLSGQEYIVQRHRDWKGVCLVSSPRQIARALSFGGAPLDDGTVLSINEIDAIAHGKTVGRNGKTYAFDLDKGRIDEIPQYKLRLRLSQEQETRHAPKMAL